MTRNEVTELVIAQKLHKHLNWSQLADAIGLSKEWTTAALLGQMTLNARTSRYNWNITGFTRRGYRAITSSAIQRLIADSRAYRSLDLPFLRIGQCLRHYF